MKGSHNKTHVAQQLKAVTAKQASATVATVTSSKTPISKLMSSKS